MLETGKMQRLCPYPRGVISKYVIAGKASASLMWLVKSLLELFKNGYRVLVRLFYQSPSVDSVKADGDRYD